MGLYDRDYMRDEIKRPDMTKSIIVLMAIAALISAVTYFLHEARSWRRELEPELPPPVVVSDQERLEAISPIDVNQATLQELMLLPRIGRAQAVGILEGRPFAKFNDLDDVYGIGKKTLALIRPYVIVRMPAAESRENETTGGATPPSSAENPVAASSQDGQSPGEKPVNPAFNETAEDSISD